jgi:CRISPR-associated protein Cas5h
MRLVSFQLTGRYGHFLRAEGGVSCLSYPVPPRTALLGMLGGVLGLEKDRPQELLEPARLALRGRLPQLHWHKAKLRKDPPEALPRVVKRTQKAEKTTKPEMATLIAQEWLFKPEYTVWCCLPEPFGSQLEERLRNRRWHFQPCLGLSEMAADLAFLKSEAVEPLPPGRYPVDTLLRREEGSLDMEAAFESGLVIHSFRMPRTVTPHRVFTHEAYFMERDSRPVPVETARAFQAESGVLMLL